jgi:hypothetical protein
MGIPNNITIKSHSEKLVTFSFTNAPIMQSNNTIKNPFQFKHLRYFII